MRTADIDYYARHGLIPGWNQGLLAEHSIAIGGLGGLGYVVLESAAMLGIGDRAITYLVDSDTVAPSNLSRLPMATPADIGKPKVEVAARWLRQVRPGRRVVAIHGSIFDMKSQRQLVQADSIISTLDSDLGRSVLQDLAREFMLPLIEGGSGVLVDEVAGNSIVLPSGQVRLFIPGTTACLYCTLGLDEAAIANEIAALRCKDNDALAAVGEATGYLAGSFREQAPVPSVHSINAVVGALLVRMLARYLLGGLAASGQALVVDLASPQISRLTAERGERCPVCGPEAELGLGRYFTLDGYTDVEPPPDVDFVSDHRLAVTQEFEQRAEPAADDPASHVGEPEPEDVGAAEASPEQSHGAAAHGAAAYSQTQLATDDASDQEDDDGRCG